MKKISKGMIALIVVIVLIVIAAIAIVSSYNGLVGEREKVLSAQSEIENSLQRRADLIPNLVETVKGYASHETEAINQVTEARTKMSGASTLEEKMEANEEISTALSRLLVVVENYPDLKASENFIQLSDELAGTENRIATTRRDYNNAAREYNTKIKKFPTSLIASIFNFDEFPYFEADEGAENVPQVNFD
jgi:LemA family protein